MSPCTPHERSHTSDQEPESSNMARDVPKDASETEVLPTQHSNPAVLKFAEVMENLRTAHATEIHEEKARLEEAHQIQNAAAVRERERLKRAYEAHVARLQGRIATQAVRIYALEESLYEAGDSQDVDMAAIRERYEVFCDLKGRSNNAEHNDSSNAAMEPSTNGDNGVANANSGEIGNGGGDDDAMGEALEEESRAGNAAARTNTNSKRSFDAHSSGGDSSSPPSKKMKTTRNELLNFVEKDPPRSALRMDPNYTPEKNSSSVLSWTAEFDRHGNVWRCPKCDWEVVDEEDFLGCHCPEYAPRSCPKCQLRTGDEYKLA